MYVQFIESTAVLYPMLHGKCFKDFYFFHVHRCVRNRTGFHLQVIIKVQTDHTKLARWGTTINFIFINGIFTYVSGGISQVILITVVLRITEVGR
jgi:hypothetical protein